MSQSYFKVLQRDLVTYTVYATDVLHLKYFRVICVKHADCSCASLMYPMTVRFEVLTASIWAPLEMRVAAVCMSLTLTFTALEMRSTTFTSLRRLLISVYLLEYCTLRRACGQKTRWTDGGHKI